MRVGNRRQILSPFSDLLFDHYPAFPDGKWKKNNNNVIMALWIMAI